jgi:hypothetical protein
LIIAINPADPSLQSITEKNFVLPKKKIINQINNKSKKICNLRKKCLVFPFKWNQFNLKKIKKKLFNQKRKINKQNNKIYKKEILSPFLP